MTDSSNNILISIVIPTYKCENFILKLYERLTATLKSISDSYEIIFINDCSPQNDWQEIEKIANLDNKVKGIYLSRNFGQHPAITAGIENSHGKWIVVMDCDLQDQPEEITKLYNKTKEGYEIVFGQRLRRKDSFIKKNFSKLFYFVLGYLTGTKQDSSIGNFGIYHRNVINAILSMGDNTRYFPTMVRWVGFKYTSIEVIHNNREFGKTSYSLKKLINLALDVMIAFSDRPLRLTVKLGLLISLMSLIYTLYILIKYFMNQIIITGWASVIISIWFLSGLIIFLLGIIGLYIGKTFEKVKDRPIYIIREIVN